MAGTMMMIAAAVALHVAIDLGPKRASRTSGKSPVVTCHKGAVSYKFVGTPGTKFTYGGDAWMIPIEGWIEVIADPKASDYVLAGEKLALDGGPLDAFGTRTVQVPMPQSSAQPTEGGK
jgi:hypothetical protein